MLAKDILRIVLYGVGLSSLGAVIYFAGPFVAFGDWRTMNQVVVQNQEPIAAGLIAGGALMGILVLLIETLLPK